jgi:ketosteroid isomerase-like protein
MTGKAAIPDGLSWAFRTLETMGFTTVNYFESEDGNSAAVEMATSHRLPGGRPINFMQTFVIETRDGYITRLQSYPPYGPGGIGGFLLKLTRLRRRLARHRAI